jgi:hypothetical protein
MVTGADGPRQPKLSQVQCVTLARAQSAQRVPLKNRGAGAAFPGTQPGKIYEHSRKSA